MRNSLWNDADSVIWSRKKEKGFATIPRTLSLIATLIKTLTKKGDPSRAYIDLWARVNDDGLIVVQDEAEFAISAGYADGTRNVRTWKEQMNSLETLGFIAVKPKSARKHGYILLIHPHRAVALIEKRFPKRIPSWWYEAYRDRIQGIGSKERGCKELEDFLAPVSE